MWVMDIFHLKCKFKQIFMINESRKLSTATCWSVERVTAVKIGMDKRTKGQLDRSMTGLEGQKDRRTSGQKNRKTGVTGQKDARTETQG